MIKNDPSTGRHPKKRRSTNQSRGSKTYCRGGNCLEDSLGFVQFNLNKQRQATIDLVSYIKNIDIR